MRVFPCWLAELNCPDTHRMTKESRDSGRECRPAFILIFHFHHIHIHIHACPHFILHSPHFTTMTLSATAQVPLRPVPCPSNEGRSGVSCKQPILALELTPAVCVCRCKSLACGLRLHVHVSVHTHARPEPEPGHQHAQATGKHQHDLSLECDYGSKWKKKKKRAISTSKLRAKLQRP